jgi:hypothetical protein
VFVTPKRISSENNVDVPASKVDGVFDQDRAVYFGKYADVKEGLNEVNHLKSAYRSKQLTVRLNSPPFHAALHVLTCHLQLFARDLHLFFSLSPLSSRIVGHQLFRTTACSISAWLDSQVGQ